MPFLLPRFILQSFCDSRRGRSVDCCCRRGQSILQNRSHRRCSRNTRRLPPRTSTSKTVVGFQHWTRTLGVHITVPDCCRTPADPRCRRILRLHDCSPVKRDEKALDCLLHPTGTGYIRSLHQRLEQWPQSRREIFDLSREGRNRLSQPPIPRWCSHLDSSRPYSSLHAQRPTHLLPCEGRWQEAPLHAQQTLGSLAIISDGRSRRCLSTQEIR